MTAFVETAESVIVKTIGVVPLLPSVNEADPTTNDGSEGAGAVSSLVIVPVTEVVEMDPLIAFEKFRLNDSSVS